MNRDIEIIYEKYNAKDARLQKRLWAYYSKMLEWERKKQSTDMDSKNKWKPQAFPWEHYILMHENERVVKLGRDGRCEIYNEQMMPYNLYLEEVSGDDIELRMQNLDNFYYWCASRVLTLDRKYAKAILNSIGATQAVTDRDRAQIALSYHCLSLTDVYWVAEDSEDLDYYDFNLFDNPLVNAFVDVSLRGRQITVENSHLIADDLGTQGFYPKAWIRSAEGFFLLKDGGQELVENELLASKICRCFKVNQVLYEEGYYKKENDSEDEKENKPDYICEYGEIYVIEYKKNNQENGKANGNMFTDLLILEHNPEWNEIRSKKNDNTYDESANKDYCFEKVSVSKLMTSLEQSIVSMEAFEIYAQNHDMDKMEYILKLDGYSYYMMNIVDYLIGNTDRHWGNWGLLVDNKTNRPIRLHDLMDFNMAFQAYDTIEGAKCLTDVKKITQKEAAIEAVRAVGLNQICEIQPEWFTDETKKEMFFRRLELLKGVE